MAIVMGGASSIDESTVRLFAHHDTKIIMANIQNDKANKYATTSAPTAGSLPTSVATSLMRQTSSLSWILYVKYINTRFLIRK